MLRIILISIISISASASNLFVALSDISLPVNERPLYTKLSLCESLKGQCIKVPNGCQMTFLCDLVNEEIDDLNSPIYSEPSFVESCSTQSDCNDKYTNLECQNDKPSIISDNQVGCRSLLGYNKKLTGKKTLVLNSVKLSQFESQEQKRRETKDIILLGSKLRESCDSALKYLSGKFRSYSEAESQALSIQFGEVYSSLTSCFHKRSLRLIGEISDPDHEDLKNTLISILNRD